MLAGAEKILEFVCKIGFPYRYICIRGGANAWTRGGALCIEFDFVAGAGDQ